MLGVLAVLAGKIIRFDQVRGYGFIAPEPGGDDVFVHANDLSADEVTVSVGTRVEFEMVEGERGPKAYGVRVLGPPSPPGPAGAGDAAAEDECAALGEREFGSELVELLLTSVPTLTGAQIIAVGTAALRLARSHGWID